MTFDPQSIASFFDQYGQREWDRLVATPAAEISLHIHLHYLRRFIKPDMRVLEIGAGAGRFTQALAELGVCVLVADISPGQLALNREFAARLGFAGAVEDWQETDICDLSRWSDASFDAVVAYGGPFSYVLERRDQALSECLRVLKPGGRLLASVMLLWGTVGSALASVLDVPPEYNTRIIATGDLTPATLPERTRNLMHMFRADEVRVWLAKSGRQPLALSASGVLANGLPADVMAPIRQDEVKWQELLRMELEASADSGALDMGTHLIFVV